MHLNSINFIIYNFFSSLFWTQALILHFLYIFCFLRFFVTSYKISFFFLLCLEYSPIIQLAIINLVCMCIQYLWYTPNQTYIPKSDSDYFFCIFPIDLTNLFTFSVFVLNRISLFLRQHYACSCNFVLIESFLLLLLLYIITSFFLYSTYGESINMSFHFRVGSIFRIYKPLICFLIDTRNLDMMIVRPCQNRLFSSLGSIFFPRSRYIGVIFYKFNTLYFAYFTNLLVVFIARYYYIPLFYIPN